MSSLHIATTTAPADTTPGVGDMVLVVDTSEVAVVLEAEGFQVRHVATPDEALSRCEHALVLIMLQTDASLRVLERIHARRPDLPVILITESLAIGTAIDALRSGAYDLVTKPVSPALLVSRVKRASDFAILTRELKRMRRESPRPSRFVGSSRAMRAVLDLITRVAASETAVLIHGETGTGKELVARSIHETSNRSSGPLVAINCAAVPATLLEAELFGHSRGAFTDAKVSRPGLFVQANGGVLFLDEVGEMPLEMQAKLLRALQERAVRPVGATADVAFDARVLCSTHRDLDQMVADGTFRRDLYYRINVVCVEVPPLRARGNDVIELATFMLDRAAARDGRAPIRLSAPVAERLLGYDWPGNVRELENAMERAVVLAQFETLTPDDLPERVRAHHSSRLVVAADEPEDIVTLEVLERRYIERVIVLLGGNKSRAADLLGLDRRTLYRRLEKYGERATPR